MATNAFEEALLHFETARRGRSDDAMDEQLADVEFGLARSKFAGLSPEYMGEVFGHMENAFDYFSSCGLTDKAVQVGILPIYPRPGSLVESLPLIEKTRALIDDDHPMLGHVIARHGFAIGRRVKISILPLPTWNMHWKLPSKQTMKISKSGPTSAP